ncbi:MAG: DUF3108 domain-containing protein [Candidatus Omnitrophica bacterium]|nr:DUF3108 domain-containing protein [Candidatus Omnitrophota bacterium]
MNGSKIRNSKFETLILKFIVILTAFTMAGCGTLARYKQIETVTLEDKEVEIELKEAKPELRIGEKLTYEIYWMKMPVGIVVTEIKEMVELNGRQAYRLVGSARSNKWLNFLFKVDDYMESFLDKETLLSIRHTAVRKEGKYSAYLVLDYDWDNKIVKFQNLKDGTNKTFPLPTEAVDEFSAFYCFRLKEITTEKPLEFTVNQVEKNWLLKIAITSFGKMNLPGVGVFDAFMAEPVPQLGEKTFDKGSAWVWLSNDENRIPLMMKVHMNIPVVGTVVAVLQKIE